ncbi:MAG: nicotinate-nicotinamide nucleotide adenylyltransferase [Candidatus Microsaccharimonas sp.]
MEQLRKQETIIYGGAFNPPTLAHKAILEACIGYAQSQQADIWVLPSGDRQDKTIATPRDLRIAYVNAMIESIEDRAVEPWVVTSELDRTVLVETYDTLKELELENPDRRFTFVFGADSTQTMASWKGGRELLDELSMLVVEREGSEINPLARHAVRMTVQTPNVSSTQVRERLAVGAPVDDLVSGPVALLLR